MLERLKKEEEKANATFSPYGDQGGDSPKNTQIDRLQQQGAKEKEKKIDSGVVFRAQLLKLLKIAVPGIGSYQSLLFVAQFFLLIMR